MRAAWPYTEFKHGTDMVAGMDIPGVGPMCGITSPGGVTFYAFTPTASA